MARKKARRIDDGLATMTRTQFQDLVSRLGNEHPGNNRQEWQRIAALDKKVIPAHFLTGHIAHLETVARQKRRTADFLGRREAAERRHQGNVTQSSDSHG